MVRLIDATISATGTNDLAGSSRQGLKGRRGISNLDDMPLPGSALDGCVPLLQSFLWHFTVRWIELVVNVAELQKYPEVMADFFGWIPEIEEWLIAKCDTVSERQMAEEERKALSAGGEQFRQFLELRNLREACIQISVAGERVKRRTQYLSLGGRN